MATVNIYFDTLAEGDPAALLPLLDDAERARAARFRFERDRRRFVMRRAKLRRLLGQLTGTDPRALAFTHNAHGKPMFAGGPYFSLSHSGDRMMVAVAGVDVGCDLEAIDLQVDCARIATDLFSPAEASALAGLPQAQRQRGFFDCWARKEAFVKALGQGLSYPLTAFEVSVGFDAALRRGGEGWQVAAVAAGAGYAAAIVARDDGAPLILNR